MLTLEPTTGVLTDGERAAQLTLMQSRLMTALARRRGAVGTIGALMQELYPSLAHQPGDSVVAVVVHHIRRRMQAAGLPQTIRTHRGVGFSCTDVVLADARPILLTQGQRAIIQELIETHPNERLAERAFAAMAA